MAAKMLKQADLDRFEVIKKNLLTVAILSMNLNIDTNINFGQLLTNSILTPQVKDVHATSILERQLFCPSQISTKI